MYERRQDGLAGAKIMSARDLLKALAPYREPNQRRSAIELAVTIVPFVVLWAGAWWALSLSYWLTLAICVPAGAFLTRIFLIQHDCGHGAFFCRRALNDRIGRVLGILTLTPYRVWQQSHATHHATSGNLGRRGTGDIDVLTVREYRALPRWRQVLYWLYRHPLVLFGIGPAYYFLLRNRLPLGFSTGDRHFWISTMGTNLAIALTAVAMILLLGPGPFLAVQVPITLLASSIGVWLFYVQHQFEETVWDENTAWDRHEAALYGSSHYELPGLLRWLSANIGVHHVHHLSSRIPYYRLPQVLRDFPELAKIRRLTIIESLKCVRLRLWDEDARRLVSFAEAKRIPA